jgi:GNAT superfamily N-acetyltransferase
VPEIALEQLPYVGLRTFCRTVAQASEDARAVELDGVTAAVVPAAPDRSVANSVMYDSPAALEAALAALTRTYDDAGVRAWTVWVPAGDGSGSAVLERAGHTLDGLPTAMAMTLDGFDRAPSPEVAIDDEPDLTDIGRLNDRAYGFEGDQFERALTRCPPGMHAYVARLEGTPAACVAAADHGEDCGIYFVATAAEARGRGLATELLVRALADARRRGRRTTSLQSTAMGRPVYERLGYRDLGTLQMWERRRPL